MWSCRLNISTTKEHSQKLGFAVCVHVEDVLLRMTRLCLYPGRAGSSVSPGMSLLKQRGSVLKVVTLSGLWPGYIFKLYHVL